MAVYALAYYLRPRLCDEDNYRYFFPALTLKIIGAIAIGFLYQFYYNGGDTFGYHTHGSRVIWETLWNHPFDAVKLMLPVDDHAPMYQYASKMSFYYDASSMVIVRIAAIVDILTFSSYSGTAVLFALVSFLGSWCLFRAFYELFPDYKHRIAIAVLFVPSVIFWGSGILKDTVVIACLGFIVYMLKTSFIDWRPSLLKIIGMLIAAYVIYEVKKYVLLCFVPAALLWIYIHNLSLIPSVVGRILVTPMIIIIGGFSAYYAVQKIGENDPRYALDRLAETARITAYDIGFYSGKNAGSGYTLGEQDGSFRGMIALFPQAVNVSLFRPYIWEAKNPLMVLASLEATALLLLTLWLLFRRPLAFIRSLADPNVLFCLTFSVTFAFAVGVSTYNFGTLTRYRIPLLPFYLIGLVIVNERTRKIEEPNSLQLHDPQPSE